MAAFHFPEHNCVLIHIPKTGGTSIRNGFFQGAYEGPAQGKIPEEWAHCYKFAFVRNPFDRLISAWKMFADGMENTKWKFPTDAIPNITLLEFLDIVRDESIPYDGIRTTFERKIRHHTLPLVHPFHCLDRADFVGRFETFDADFSNICQKIGASGELPHWNKTEHIGYQNYYSNHTKQIIEEHYHDDLVQFGYSF